MYSLVAVSQSEDINDISNRLLCNAYVYKKADKATLNFIKKNFPYLAKEPPPGGWVMPPIGRNSNTYVISMKFKHHPFFDFKLKEGSLNFHAVESGGDVFETGADVLLAFSDSSDANAAFEELVHLYKSVSQKNELTRSDDEETATFSGIGQNRSYEKAELIKTIIESFHLFTIRFRWRL